METSQTTDCARTSKDSQVTLAALEVAAVVGDPPSQWMDLKVHGKGNGSKIESKSIRAG